MTQEAVKPPVGTEIQPGTVNPEEGHGTFFEFTDKSESPIDTNQMATEPIVEFEAPPKEEKNLQDEFIDVDFKDEYGFELEDYDSREDLGKTEEPPKLESPSVETEPKKDPTQKEYWQSQADVRGRDLSYVLGTVGVNSVDEFRANYQEYKNILPIARYIKKNPGVIDNVGQSFTGEKAGQPSGIQSQAPKKPERPTMPTGYNRVDSVQDPDSESFKYREANESYRDEMMQYQIGTMNYQSEQAQMVHQQELQSQQVEATKNTLVSNYGLEPNQAVDFINYMTSPESESLDNLVLLYKMRQMPKGTIAQNLRKADEFRKRAIKHKEIKPGLGGAVSGPKVRPLTEEQEFNLSLIGRNRNK